MKRNVVFRGEAFRKNDQNAICGLVNVSGERSITFVNRCNYPIWMNPFPTVGNGIQRLEQNARTIYNIPDSGWKGRFWPKTECDGNGQNCAVGQSVPPCPSGGCQPPAETKVEFFFPTMNDRNSVWYDISLVDGYSLPMEIIPDKQVSGWDTQYAQSISMDFFFYLGRILYHHQLCHEIRLMSFQ